MFDWFLDTHLFLNSYYLHGLSSSMYIFLFQNVSKMWFQDHKVVLRSFYLSNSKSPFSFWTQGFLLNDYLLHFCYLLVIRSYNNPMLSKFNTFIKSKLEVNWRKKLKPLTDAALPIFF